MFKFEIKSCQRQTKLNFTIDGVAEEEDKNSRRPKCRHLLMLQSTQNFAMTTTRLTLTVMRCFVGRCCCVDFGSAHHHQGPVR